MPSTPIPWVRYFAECPSRQRQGNVDSLVSLFPHRVKMDFFSWSLCVLFMDSGVLSNKHRNKPHFGYVYYITDPEKRRLHEKSLKSSSLCNVRLQTVKATETTKR